MGPEYLHWSQNLALGVQLPTGARVRRLGRASHQTRVDLSPDAKGVNRENVPGHASGPLPPRKPAVLGASALVACHVVQRLDVADAVGPCRAAVPDHLRHMVGDENAPKIHGHQRAHDLLHVRIAVIHKGLDEARNGRADVAEMDLPKLAHVREGPRRFQNALAHPAAAFHPGAATETDADVRAVGDSQGAHVAVEVAEDAARHAAQLRHRRIIRVNADPYPQLFGHGRHPFDKERVVLPELFPGELAAVRQRRLEGLAVPRTPGGLEAEGAGRRVTARTFPRRAPDAVAHVRVGRVKDPGPGQVAQVLLVFRDFLIATGQVEGDLGHVMDAGVADVRDFQTAGLDALLVPYEGLVGAAAGRNADIFDTQLFGEYQIVRGEVAGDL